METLIARTGPNSLSSAAAALVLGAEHRVPATQRLDAVVMEEKRADCARTDGGACLQVCAIFDECMWNATRDLGA